MQVQFDNIGHISEHGEGLQNVSVTVDSGQCLVVSGRSGCGKSLLFSIVCGLINPQQGRVLFDGKDMAVMDRVEEMHFRRHLGIVFQVPALISNLTLAENLMLPLNLHCPNLRPDEKRVQVETTCEEFGLTPYMDDRTDQLSSGLASLAGLARALICSPACLIWDAPFTEIDVQWSRHVIKRLLGLRARGTTFVLFSNRQQVIGDMADIHLNLSCDGSELDYAS